MRENIRRAKLQEFIESLGLDHIQFAININVPDYIIKDILAGNKPIYTTLYDRIIFAYPDVNLHWLMTGQGAPLLKDASENTPGEEPSLTIDDPTRTGTITQEAIRQVESNQLDQYFELMDKVTPTSESHTYEALRQSFLADKTPPNFEQKLKVFTRKIARLNSDNNNPIS
ncbi:hypothetical protein [uncultured Microscilla sp.]|uniref:hypothetical protein n=1 Tax=uncultured Microscilla sp. TaxID=432653 RepID=UPI002632E0FE|nr:hypothetical protein [uncultured Microscilla sp.]